MNVRWGAMAAAAWIVIACRIADPLPAPLDTANDACAFCRMVASDPRFASQIVAPYEEPRFFDDLGCLTRYLARDGALSPKARVYVADHRTKAWVPAREAVYTKVTAVSAPMGSRILAHESAASRDADPDARGGVPVDAGAILDGHVNGDRP